jgi:hypothetical protein
MYRLVLSFVALALTALIASGPAKADALYSLTYDSCTGGCGNGAGTNNNSFGYVTLHQINSTQVSVTLQVTAPSYFVNTGNGTNHAPLAFNVDKSVTISGLADAYSNPSSFFTTGATNANVSGLGTFTNEIACTSNCPNGASNGGAGSWMYFVATASSGLSLSDFVANSGGFFFAADIIGPSGNTGEVAAKNAPTTTTGGGGGGSPAPEPASILPFGAGLLALGAALRVRRRATITR